MKNIIEKQNCFKHLFKHFLNDHSFYSIFKAAVPNLFVNRGNIVDQKS